MAVQPAALPFDPSAVTAEYAARLSDDDLEMHCVLLGHSIQDFEDAFQRFNDRPALRAEYAIVAAEARALRACTAERRQRTGRAQRIASPPSVGMAVGALVVDGAQNAACTAEVISAAGEARPRPAGHLRAPHHGARLRGSGAHVRHDGDLCSRACQRGLHDLLDDLSGNCQWPLGSRPYLTSAERTSPPPSATAAR